MLRGVKFDYVKSKSNNLLRDRTNQILDFEVNGYSSQSFYLLVCYFWNMKRHQHILKTKYKLVDTSYTRDSCML